MLLRKEERFRKVSAVLRHFYPDCGYGFSGIKHMIDTHVNLVNAYESLQFFIHFISYEAYTDMGLNPPFREVERAFRISKVPFEIRKARSTTHRP